VDIRRRTIRQASVSAPPIGGYHPADRRSGGRETTVLVMAHRLSTVTGAGTGFVVMTADGSARQTPVGQSALRGIRSRTR
jgi:hypothetical protein